MDCLEYLTEKGYDLQSVGAGKYRFSPCPFCKHNDCFTVFSLTNSWYCFSEERGGGIKELKRAFGEEVKEEQGEARDIDITFLIEVLHDCVGRTNYYQSRGLNKTIDKYKLGFSEKGLNFFAGKIPSIKPFKTIEWETFYSCYKFILPIWDIDGRCRYFIARRDDAKAQEFKEKYKREVPKTKNLAGLSARIFNDAYLRIEEPPRQLFIVEGIFDALSLEEEGYYAIALNSVANFNKFLELCRDNKGKLKDTEFILIPDNDDAGRRLGKRFEEDFIFNARIIKLPDCKDCNEYFIKHKELKETITELLNRKETVFWVADYLEDFLLSIGRQRIIRTGFTKLDEFLGGGLRAGFTVLGGLTSLGKTSLALQVAKNIAEQDIPVFYFALEEARNDLMAKLLSSISHIYGINLSATDIIRKNFSLKEEDSKLILEKFKAIGEKIAIFEGTFGTGAEEIREEIERYVSEAGLSPVIIVDYLQILKPSSDAGIKTDKQALDFAVSELKRIARDFETVVIGISSINRGSYSEAFTYEALKESGGIEYTADIVLGLQLPLDDKNTTNTRRNTADAVKEAFKKEPVNIELKILKNRYGRAHEVIPLSFYPKYSFFEELK
jgi:replicative DNA helicase